MTTGFIIGAGSGDSWALTLENKITNCLLEVPQRIKLELNNGTLTLKAGSKVIVPNGFEADGTTRKFDVVTIDNDIQAGEPLASFTDKWFLSYRNNGFYWELLSNCFSGPTLPTQTGENRLGYNTTLNKFQTSTGGGAYIDNICSFPICIFSTTSGVITSIDQVFNGMGYIGSTVWVDKGVKGLIPDGRNADGSLKNIEFTTSKVLTKTFDSTTTTPFVLGINQNHFSIDDIYFYSQEEKPTAYNYIWYKPSENILINYNGTIIQGCVCIDAYRVNGAITSFQPKLPFRAVDYNDFEEQLATKTDMLQASGAGMPSNKYIDLTLNASGSTYTAPANGWVFIAKNSTATNQQCRIVNISKGQIAQEFYSSSSSQAIRSYIPVQRGDNYIITYTLGGSTVYFRFIYAEGEV